MYTNDWQWLLEQNRLLSAQTRRVNLCALERARGYRMAGDLPAPLLRAQGFAAVLDNLPLRHDGGWLAGNPWDLTAGELPAGLPAEEYDGLMGELARRGQRDFWAGFDHSLADYPNLLAKGVGGLLALVEGRLSAETDADKLITLRGFHVALKAFSRFALRQATAAEEAGDEGAAELCRAVAEDAPRTFPAALQLVWLTHLAFKTEGRAHMALGRLDQYLLPFYEDDLRHGRLTREEAGEWICHLFARLDAIGEVQNICIGGQTPAGTDAVNELSYLILECVGRVNSPHTNLSARFFDGTSPRFLRACFELIRTGIGFPAVFNDEVLVPGLVEVGIPLEHARDACMVGCIETMLSGCQPPWSDSRFNSPVYLLSALERAEVEGCTDFDAFQELFREETRQALAAHAQMINEHRALFPAERFPDPFLSVLTRDCISRGLDIHAGGAVFPPFHGIAVMGLATIADSLAALRRLVFTEHSLTLAELNRALRDDFHGAETLRQMLLHRAPKYGNDLPEVDELAADYVDWIACECLRLKFAEGGLFVAAMAANVQNISAGKEVGATPDGRHAFTPLSDAASPYFGRDEQGPTAFLRSVAKPDYQRVLTGSVINMRFDPAFFQDEEGAQRFLSFLRYFIAARIPELQFNFTSAQTLQDALRDPEHHRDLVVRVSGFSARFVELAREVQEDIARRRAHR